MGKNYKDLSINDEIEKKIHSLNKVRDARIFSSKRLERYSWHWDLLFFLFNILAVIIVILSLTIKDDCLTIFSACYTLYVILLQYFIGLKNYNERALRIHYHQLALEKNIIELKSLLIDKNISNYYKLAKYKQIMHNYELNLSNIENHKDRDFKKANKNQLNLGDQIDSDGLFIVCNYLIFSIVLIGCSIYLLIKYIIWCNL